MFLTLRTGFSPPTIEASLWFSPAPIISASSTSTSPGSSLALGFYLKTSSINWERNSLLLAWTLNAWRSATGQDVMSWPEAGLSQKYISVSVFEYQAKVLRVVTWLQTLWNNQRDQFCFMSLYHFAVSVLSHQFISLSFLDWAA